MERKENKRDVEDHFWKMLSDLDAEIDKIVNANFGEKIISDSDEDEFI